MQKAERELDTYIAAVISLQDLPLVHLIRCVPIKERALEFFQTAALNWSLGAPRPADLPGVTRYNAVNALARNASILQIPVNLLESDDGNSLFFEG